MPPCNAGQTGGLLRAATAVARVGLIGADNISASLLTANSVAARVCAKPMTALRAAHVAALKHGWSAAVAASARAHRHLTAHTDPG